MKHLLAFLIGMLMLPLVAVRANVADSVLILAYNTNPRQGLMLAYSANGVVWKSIADGRTFVSSDYGTWGAEKRMFNPSIARKTDGTWVAVWGVNERANQFAIATTPDLLHWKPQDYPYMPGVGQCLEPLVSVVNDRYVVCFHDAAGQWYQTSSSDAYHFSSPERISPV